MRRSVLQYIAHGHRCPKCGEAMQAMMASGGYAPEGFEPEYDHWWCGTCVEVVMFDDDPIYLAIES